MPKPGKTTHSFTKYHLFFCLQKRFFTINWTYRAFPPHPGNFHSPFPDTSSQIQFKMQAMLVVIRKWPRWALMPSRSEAVSRGRIDTQGKQCQCFPVQYFSAHWWCGLNPSAEMRRVNMLSRSQWSILSSDFTSMHPLCRKKNIF